MTSPVPPEVAGPEVVGEVLAIDPNAIDPDWPGRVGQFFPLKSEGLARLIDADGQHEPIRIMRAGNKAKLPWRLVAGLHRWDACRSLGRAVEARVFTGTKEEARRLQASENIDRRQMTVLERAMFVAAVAEAAQARVFAVHGVDSAQALGAARTNARGNLHRASNDIRYVAPDRAQDQMAKADAEAQAAVNALSSAYGWREEVCAALDMSLDKVKRSLRIYRQIVEPHRALLDAIKDHPIANNQDALVTLAGQTAAMRAAVLEWFGDHPDATTLDQAMVALGAARSKGDRAADQQEGQTKFLTRAESNLERLSPSVWRSWAPSLAKKIKPSALLAVRDAIDAQIAALGGADGLGGDDA